MYIMGRAAGIDIIIIIMKRRRRASVLIYKKRILLYASRYKLTRPTVDLSNGTNVFAFDRRCCFLFPRIGSTGRRTSAPGLRETVERFNLISYNNIVALAINNNIIL